MKEKYINLKIKKILKNNNKKTIIDFFFFFLYLVFEFNGQEGVDS